MSTTVTYAGLNYVVPAVGDSAWGANVSAYLIALASGSLTKTGGAFTLAADANFGPSFGLLSKYFTSVSANSASTGAVRLANTDSVSFRNSGNTADLALKPDADGVLQYGGVDIATISATQILTNKTISGASNTLSNIGYSSLTLAGSIVNADISASAGIVYSKLNLTGSVVNADIATGAAIAYSKLSLSGAIQSSDLAGSIAASKLVGSDIATVGTITSGTWSATTIAVNKGGTGVTASSGASSVMLRDTNQNVAINNINEAFATTVTSASPVTFTVSSAPLQQFTGTTAQTVNLPAANAAGMATGVQFYVFNRSTGTLTVKDGGGTTVQAIAGGGQCCFTCTATGSAAGSWDTTYTFTGTLPVSLGGTGVTSVTTVPAATSFAGWDANKNLSANNFLAGYRTQALGTPVTLVVGDAELQYFTGSGATTVTLPVASTLVLGQSWEIVNNGSSGNLTINSSGANLVTTISPGSAAVVTCILTSGTTAASWSTNSAGGSASPLTTKGDIYTFSSTNVRLPVGTDGQAFIADSAQTTGNKWGTLGIAGGGTGQTTANPAFNALSPLTTKGDTLVYTTVNARQSVPADYGALIPDAAQTSGWRSAPYTAMEGRPGKNYIQYADFENNATTGWTATGCATVTNGLPVSVGSGAAAFSSSNGGRTKNANTSSPAIDSSSAIAGTYALNLATTGAGAIGDGYISSAYTIDAADQAKVLAFKLYYKVASGSPNMSGTISNTYAVAIYDVANNAWLGVAGGFNFTQSSGVGICQGTFQTASNTTSIQIFIYSPVAPTGASSLLIDDVYVGPQALAFGPAMDDWIAYTPTFVGFGTPTGVNFQSRRVGDTLQVRGVFASGTSTATTAQIGLGYKGAAGNVTIDATKVTALAQVGSGALNVAVATDITVLVPSGVSVSFVNLGEQSGGLAGLSAINGNAITSGTTFSIFFEVPIAGWSSNTAMSADTDTRVIALEANGSATTIGATPQDIVWTTTVKDSAGAFNGTTYTVQTPGFYIVATKLRSTGTYTATSAGTTIIMKNGAAVSQEIVQVGSSSSTLINPLGFYGGWCNAGDTLKIQYSDSGTSPSLISSSVYNTLSIFRLAGPAVVAATESVNASYSTAAGQSIANGATPAIVFGTKTFDSHGAMNTSTGAYTSVVSGKLHVEAAVEFANASWTASGYIWLQVFKNGSQYKTICFNRIQATLTTSFAAQGSCLVDVLAGDTVDVRVAHAESTARTLSVTAANNYVCIHRVGN